MLRRSRLLPFLLALLAGAGCRAPREQPPVGASRLGWGRTFGVEAATLRVRAVPAALAPGRPEVRLGKPGWGGPNGFDPAAGAGGCPDSGHHGRH